MAPIHSLFRDKHRELKTAEVLALINRTLADGQRDKVRLSIERTRKAAALKKLLSQTRPRSRR